MCVRVQSQRPSCPTAERKAAENVFLQNRPLSQLGTHLIHMVRVTIVRASVCTQVFACTHLWCIHEYLQYLLLREWCTIAGLIHLFQWSYWSTWGQVYLFLSWISLCVLFSCKKKKGWELTNMLHDQNISENVKQANKCWVTLETSTCVSHLYSN